MVDLGDGQKDDQNKWKDGKTDSDKEFSCDISFLIQEFLQIKQFFDFFNYVRASLCVCACVCVQFYGL